MYLYVSVCIRMYHCVSVYKCDIFAGVQDPTGQWHKRRCTQPESDAGEGASPDFNPNNFLPAARHLARKEARMYGCRDAQRVDARAIPRHHVAESSQGMVSPLLGSS
jgi:hypothetical protein